MDEGAPHLTLMTWIYLPTFHSSQELVGLISEPTTPDTSARSAMLSSTDTLKPSSSPGCETDNLTTRPFGTTSKPSTEGHGGGWTLSAADSLAKMFPTLANVLEWVRELGLDFGDSSIESFAKLNPDSSWSKMFSGYSQLTMDGGSELFSETWPRRGTMRSGSCFRPPMSEHRIEESASGLWPTPKSSPSGPDFARMNREGSGGDDLVTAVERERRKKWPTPRAEDSQCAGIRHSRGTADTLYAAVLVDQGAEIGKARFATPKSRDWKGQSQRGIHAPMDALGNMDRGDGRPIGGQLNPPWVEWLMGWPLGWTVLDFAGMEWFASSRPQRGGRSSKKRKP